MNPRAVVAPKAERDLDEQFAYIARDNLDAAVRFLHAARASFDLLASMPGIGAVRRFSIPKLGKVRMWPIKGFENHLIYYRPSSDGVEILRIIYAARNQRKAMREGL